MDHKKHQSGGSSSSSSFTENLFGPKDASSASSSGLFSTVFGPSSTVSFSLFLDFFYGLTQNHRLLLFSFTVNRITESYALEFVCFQGLGRHPSHSNNTGSSKNKESGGLYGSGKPSTPDYKTQRSAGPVYQNETAEPSYLSSSIYYGGQEDYAPNTETTRPPHTSKKDGGDNDPNGSSASRGNWWQGSLYY
ncbi:hypothetical protein HanHA300_Chr07g0256801 [Helianthus annuus]|nr:hypothetical protein HanHA300_Chr07g0256801 [Helianthus annuus]KAJ0732434.1 hypothetical protein HanOQP8_Chr07g0263181 [Helianthus annuus]